MSVVAPRRLPPNRATTNDLRTIRFSSHVRSSLNAATARTRVLDLDGCIVTRSLLPEASREPREKALLGSRHVVPEGKRLRDIGSLAGDVGLLLGDDDDQID